MDAPLDWTALPGHEGTEYNAYMPATGDHDYRGLLGPGGFCTVCGRAYDKATDSAVYRLLKDADGNTVGRLPADPSGTHGRSYAACEYDGSIAPGDLYALLQREGVRVEVADWKYGWPHKLYIDGQRGLHAKFYTTHLKGIASAAARAALINEIARRTGIQYRVEDGRLFYGPSPGVQ